MVEQWLDLIVDDYWEIMVKIININNDTEIVREIISNDINRVRKHKNKCKLRLKEYRTKRNK